MLDTKRDEMLRTLAEHPAFKALLEMFDEEAAQLRSKLENERQPNVESYYFLQAGLKWLRYARLKSKQAVDKRLETLAVKPVPTDMEQLNQVLSQFEGV